MLDTFRLVNIKAEDANSVSIFLKDRKHPSYDVIIDIGTFNGQDYTIPGYKLGYTLFSFELLPQNQNRTIQAFIDQGLEENIDYTLIDVVPGTVPKVDTSKRPHIYFFKAGVSLENKGVRTLKADVFAQVDPESDGELNSAVVRIDDIISENEKVFILKSDTQGHEYGVVKGASELLKRGVHILLMEFWPQGARNNGFNATDTLNLTYDLGYQCFDLGFHSNYIPIDRPSEIHAFSDFLDSIPRRIDPIGGWEDIFCTRTI
ncbi:hypothetical protein HK096_000894 [Nowakowskiella sp. JEL0078]|nr:hypothetical protein HK096_000894 [Nowakowskiella sp. JEL0078]